MAGKRLSIKLYTGEIQIINIKFTQNPFIYIPLLATYFDDLLLNSQIGHFSHFLHYIHLLQEKYKRLILSWYGTAVGRETQNEKKKVEQKTKPVVKPSTNIPLLIALLGSYGSTMRTQSQRTAVKLDVLSYHGIRPRR